jgi:hypothetical protein
MPKLHEKYIFDLKMSKNENLSRQQILYDLALSLFFSIRRIRF